MRCINEKRVVRKVEPKRRIFIDTEFIELGPKHPTHLISLGIVREDGTEYYAIDEKAPLHLATDWHKVHVIPQLNWEFAKPRETIVREVMDFVDLDIPPEFWAYYADYDWVVFCQLFGTMMGLPATWPKVCFDLKQYHSMLGSPALPKIESSGEHHALADARWNRKVWEFLEEQRRQKGFPK